MSTYRLVATLGSVILLVLCLAATAERLGAQRSLATVKSLHCTFPVYATGTWTDGQPEAEVRDTDLSFRFEGIDTDEGVADAVGLFGPSYIVTRLAGESLHFMQVGSAGPLYVTSVFGQPDADGALLAVHTRHEYTPVSVPGFTSRPEQYYGECRVDP